MADPADRSKLSDGLYESILGAIIDGEFPEGTKLPTENELAARYAVSRPVIREALARLRYDGIVTSRRGAGSFVVRRPREPLRGGDRVTSVADIQRCFEFRTVLESEIAGLAAERAEEADIARIAATYERLASAMETGADAIEEDVAFHFALAQATGNHFFVSALAGVENQMRFAIEFGKMLSTVSPGVRLGKVIREHREVLDAVRRKDPAAARAAMGRHLSNSRRRVFEGDV